MSDKNTYQGIVPRHRQVAGVVGGSDVVTEDNDLQERRKDVSVSNINKWANKKKHTEADFVPRYVNRVAMVSRH
jgi:hypothetical protein